MDLTINEVAKGQKFYQAEVSTFGEANVYVWTYEVVSVGLQVTLQRSELNGATVNGFGSKKRLSIAQVNRSYAQTPAEALAAVRTELEEKLDAAHRGLLAVNAWREDQ